MQLAALVVLYRFDSLSDTLFHALRKDFKELVDDCAIDRECFREKWSHDRTVPSLELVYKIDKMNELKRAVDKRDAAGFSACLTANRWLVDFPGSDGKTTIGEYIIKQYARTIEEIERGNKQKGFPVAHEYSESPTALVNQFQSLLQECIRGSATLFKIDKALFYFYDDSFLHAHFTHERWSSFSIWISYGGPLQTNSFNGTVLTRYDQSRLHDVRITYAQGKYSWCPVTLGEFDTSLSTYEREELPCDNEHERAELVRARVVGRFFLMIENANFSDALELLRDNPWLARSKSYSAVPSWMNLDHGNIPHYAINPLVSLAKCLIKGNIVDEELSSSTVLAALLIALGADCALRTDQYDLPKLLEQNGCEELRMLRESFMTNPEKFRLLYNPPLQIEQPELDDVPLLSQEEQKEKDAREAEAWKAQQVKAEREEARQELAELNEQTAQLSSGSSSAGSFIKSIGVGTLGAGVGYLLKKVLLFNYGSRGEEKTLMSKRECGRRVSL